MSTPRRRVRRPPPSTPASPKRVRWRRARPVDSGEIGEDEWAAAGEDEPTLTRVTAPSPIGAELARLLARPGWSERMGAAQVAARWETIVGEELAQHCEPVRTAGRVLTVRAESAAWATQLRYFTTQIAQRVDEVLGAGSVREVRIIVGRLEGPSDDRPATAADAGSVAVGHAGDPDDPGPADPGPLDPSPPARGPDEEPS
jgi:hypothetical protein